MVITKSDTILQEYYITKRYKSTIHEGIYIVKAERCSRAARGTSRTKQEKSWEEVLRRCPSFCCTLITTGDPLCALISYSQATMIQALESGHGNPGLLATPASTYTKARWRAYMCTGNVYREYKHV